MSDRLELTWYGKDRRLLSHGDDRYEWVDPTDWRVSETRLLHDVDTVGDPNSGNLLIHGDAMHALDALINIPHLAARYLGKVKLVYIDPPFNTGQAFTHYDDNLEHSVWLTLLRDRLTQIHQLLAPDGSVWVHLDDVEQHRARSVLDEVFGAENFEATVVWQKVTSPRNDTTGFSVSQDYILVYGRGSGWSPNRMERLASSNTSRYKSRDGDPVPWRDGDATAGQASTHQHMVYAIQHPVTGGLMYPTPGRCWGRAQSWFLEQMSQYAEYELRDIGDEERRAVICGTKPEKVKQGVPAIMLAEPLADAAASARARHVAGGWPELVFLDIEKERVQRKKHMVDGGRVPETLWMASEVGGSLRATNQVKGLFPDSHAFATPKPEELLQRIVRIASDPGDIVLDCFGGSGATAAVAHKMGRRWVTVEVSGETVSTFLRPRLEMVVNGEDPGGITVVETPTGEGLPDGVKAGEAKAAAKVLAAFQKAGALDEVDGLDETAVEAAVKALRDAEKTTSELRWSGGGGFTHVEVGPSMFEEIDGTVVMADWAVGGELTEAVAAQLGFDLDPEGPLAGRKGRKRLAVVDGMVTEAVVEHLVGLIGDDETLLVVGRALAPGVEDRVRELRSGSRARKIPRDLATVGRLPSRLVRLKPRKAEVVG